MYLIKSITFNFARRLKLISSIIVGTVKDILRLVLYPLSLPLKLLLNRPKRRKFKRYKPQLNHKHDNYQSQIDMLARKINELLLNDEAYNKQFNRLENRVTELFKIDISTDKQLDKFGKSLTLDLNKLEKKYEHILGCWNVYGDSIESLEAKVNKMLSENSELTFKPLTKEEEVSLEIANGETKWHQDVDSHYEEMVKKYPDEPDFQAEQKAMVKQMAKIAERDDK